jgi:predicted nucleic acid-binding protein
LEQGLKQTGITLLDTNVIVDLLMADPVWMPWSAQQIRLAKAKGQMRINIVVYAECCVQAYTQSKIDVFLQDLNIEIAGISTQVAKSAAQAFLDYKQRGGSKTGVLPDFFIGAQAMSEGWTLLTRDAARYRTYFPDIALICP